MSNQLPVSPHAIAGLLSRLADSPLDGASIAAALAEPVDLAAIAALATFTEDRYARVLLHRGEDFEVRLLCWLPGQSTTLHGHGEANGAFRVLEGEARETPLGEPERLLFPGDISIVTPTSTHQVANAGRSRLLTLHVYSPPLPIEQPSGPGALRVVVVGGGLSGAATALHLLKHGGPELRVTLVEAGESLGRGVAYGTTDPGHLLNVPAGRMDLDPAEPGGFLRFARSRGVAASTASLLPRRLYGDYVTASLIEAIARSPARLRVARAKATRVARAAGGGWEVQLSSGRTLEAEHVVLATGHGPSAIPPALTASFEGRSVPLHFGATRPGDLDAVAPSDRLLIVGTGLTALDVLSTLRARRHTGRVELVSLTGRWPARHLGAVVWTGAPWVIDPKALPETADGLAAWFEREVALARAAGVPWQAVVDALRPHIPDLWRRLGHAEKARFLSVHRPTWERLRHRAPAAMIDLARDLEASGWCRRRRGSVAGLAPSEDGWDVTLAVDEGEAVVRVDRVIVCTGPGSDPRSFGGPWPGLRADGLVVDDPLGLGVPADWRGVVLGVHGPSEGLWAVGGLLRTRDFEATAVPEIASQASRVAARILKSSLA